MNIDKKLVARAMSKAGEEPINDVEWAEGSVRTRLIEDFYLATILEVLADADWTSQKKRERLVLSEEENLSTFKYMYDIPLDCAKPCELAGGDSFYVENGYLYTDCSDAVLCYVRNYFSGKRKYEIVIEPNAEDINNYHIYDDENDIYTKADSFDMTQTYYTLIDEDYNFYDDPIFDPILSAAIEARLASVMVLKLTGDSQKYQLLYSESLLAENKAIKNSAAQARDKKRGKKYWAEELGLE